MSYNVNINVNIKELLYKGIEIKKALRREELRLENIENELIGVGSIDYRKQKVQTSLKEGNLRELLLDNKEKTVLRIKDLEKQLNEYKGILIQEISKIDDGEIKNILELRLIKFYPWKLIYSLVPYSKTSILRKFNNGKRIIIKNYKGA